MADVLLRWQQQLEAGAPSLTKSDATSDGVEARIVAPSQTAKAEARVARRDVRGTAGYHSAEAGKRDWMMPTVAA